MEAIKESCHLLADGHHADKRFRGRGLGPLILVGIVAILLAAHGLRKTRFSSARIDSRSLVKQSNHPRFDPNSADQRELSLIPGLGPTLAGKIVELRLERRFNKPQDLLEIPGIGPSTLAKIQDWFVWAGEDAPDGNQNNSAGTEKFTNRGAPQTVRPVKIKAGDPLLDLNKAGIDELIRLPGVGPALARRIIEERGVKPFSSVDDLMRVPGIGPKTLSKIKSMVKAIVSEK